MRFSAGNDECLGAVPIACSLTNQNNLGATSNGDGYNGLGDGVWYAFAASAIPELYESALGLRFVRRVR